MVVAVYKDGCLYEYSLETGRKLAGLLAVTLERILGALSLKVSDFDYFACGCGPGSFTGIRIGLAAAKGLNLAAGKKAIGIPTLESIANNNMHAGKKTVAAMDARRELFYCGVYKRKNGRLLRQQPERLVGLKELLGMIDNDTVVTGDALALHKDAVTKKAPAALTLDRDCWYPKGWSLIELAKDRIARRKFAGQIKPVYLYPKECQIRGCDAAKK